MKTLYLHIGMARSGTTSIQSFCANNQEELNRNGYCYPIMPFSYAKANKNRNAHFMYGWVKEKNKERNIEKENQFREQGFSQLYEAFKTYDNVILSDEGLWNCGFRGDNNVWARLRIEMKEHHFRTKVVVYLRRQDEYLFSWWGQRIKEGLYAQKTLTWEQMLTDLPVVQLDYYQVLEDIAFYVGRENIIVRRFGKQYFTNASLYEDFLTAVNLTYSDAYHINKEVLNAGLSYNNIEIKRILNQIPDMTTEEEAAFRNILVKNSSIHQPKFNYSMYSEEEAEAFYNKYRGQNQKVAFKYLGIDTDLFEFQYTAEKKWTRENEEMLEDMLFFMTQESISLRREIQTANAQLKQQQKELDSLKRLLRHPLKTIGKKLMKKSDS